MQGSEGFSFTFAFLQQLLCTLEPSRHLHQLPTSGHVLHHGKDGGSRVKELRLATSKSWLVVVRFLSFRTLCDFSEK